MNSRKVQTMTLMKSPYNIPKAYYNVEDHNPGVDYVRKSDLVDGSYYFGVCRNSSCAQWSAAKDCFVYLRTKFNAKFEEEINHPEDDDGFDLFVPFFRCYPSKEDLVLGDIDENE